ncbi:MAG: hypothetical protein LQ345_005746 [Seirophora villosa]|nr:MAG: hypothetical protein LQ345_005746 [Seirophora villosa]
MAPSAVSPQSSPSDPTLPLISLAPLLTYDPSTTPRAAASLLSALKTSGFLYLTDSPIPPSLLSRVYALSADFFARPAAEKAALAWTTPRANRGYSGMGMEKTSLRLSKEEVSHERGGQGEDQKESFEIGRDDQDGCPNRWPPGDAEFKATMLDFWARCKQLHATVMQAIALALGLESAFFADYVRQGDNTLRLLHYPAVPAGAFAGGRVRAGLHSDYGSITLLFQDGRGGLQVEQQRGSGGGFVDVTPVAGTIVMNAGDLLARWSNGLVQSTRHRVVEPPRPLKDPSPLLRGKGHEQEREQENGDQDGWYPPRYSVAYFCNPDFDQVIEALPGTWEGTQGGKLWEPIKSGVYLEQRLSATY